jgi:integration host factor subunit alpha
MAVTKEKIIESVHQELGFSKKKSTELVEQLIETIKSTLASGDDVLVSGFGKFCVNEKKGETGQESCDRRFDDAETQKGGHV